MRALVLVGAPMEAQTLYGPFEDHDAASIWADEQEFDYSYILTLHDPGTANDAVPISEPKRRFHFGKYQGKTIDEVLATNPQYIRWVYDNVGDHGTITDDEYIKAGGKIIPSVKPLPAPPRTHHSDSLPYDDDIPF